MQELVMKNSRRLTRYIYLALAASFSHAACATELGLTNYPIGVNGILDGVRPEPGKTLLLSYNMYNKADKFKDGKGDSAIPGFENTTIVSSLRTIHTWNYVAGPFTFSSGFNVPWTRSETSMMGRSDTEQGIGNIDLEPLHVNYVNSSKTFFASAYIDFFIKNGDYDSTRLANYTQNYDSATPLFAYTWFINGNWSTSGTLGIEFPLERNDETKYKSGDVFFAHPSIEYTPSSNRKLHFGLAGYYIKQLNNDSQPGVRIPGGGETRAVAIGTSVRYDFTRDLMFVLKYDHEVYYRNRAETQPLWLEIAYMF